MDLAFGVFVLVEEDFGVLFGVNNIAALAIPLGGQAINLNPFSTEIIWGFDVCTTVNLLSLCTCKFGDTSSFRNY
jgi:hypothetical protein